MLYLTVLLFVHEGQEAAFAEYEAQALALLPRHQGELLYRLRPEPEQFLHAAEEHPYEIHLLRFPDQAAFAAFRQDPERQALAPLFQQAVRKVQLLESEQ